MGYRRHNPSVYLVRWPDGIVKVGYTDCKRWRKFELRGATLVNVWYFSTSSDAINAETQMKKHLPYHRAFTSKTEAIDHLGYSGDGWTECLKAPQTVDTATILQQANTITKPFEQCSVAMLPKHAHVGCTDRQTDRLTDRVVT
jgi:predicted GIY-YIG superfamily endonuclease